MHRNGVTFGSIPIRPQFLIILNRIYSRTVSLLLKVKVKISSNNVICSCLTSVILSCCPFALWNVANEANEGTGSIMNLARPSSPKYFPVLKEQEKSQNGLIRNVSYICVLDIYFCSPELKLLMAKLVLSVEYIHPSIPKAESLKLIN